MGWQTAPCRHRDALVAFPGRAFLPASPALSGYLGIPLLWTKAASLPFAVGHTNPDGISQEAPRG